MQPLTPISPQITPKIQFFIHDLWKEFFDPGSLEEAIASRQDLRELGSFYRQQNGDFWHLEKDGRIIATVGVYEILYKGDKVGFLRRFYIDKNYRNQGLGKEILYFVENYAAEKKWKYLMFGVCESMERNKRFYFRNGYEEFFENIPQEILDDNDEWYLRKRIFKEF